MQACGGARPGPKSHTRLGSGKRGGAAMKKYRIVSALLGCLCLSACSVAGNQDGPQYLEANQNTSRLTPFTDPTNKLYKYTCKWNETICLDSESVYAIKYIAQGEDGVAMTLPERGKVIVTLRRDLTPDQAEGIQKAIDNPSAYNRE